MGVSQNWEYLCGGAHNKVLLGLYWGPPFIETTPIIIFVTPPFSTTFSELGFEARGVKTAEPFHRMRTHSWWVYGSGFGSVGLIAGSW